MLGAWLCRVGWHAWAWAGRWPPEPNLAIGPGWETFRCRRCGLTDTDVEGA